MKTLCIRLLGLATLIAAAGVATASVRVGGTAFFVNGQLARDYQYTGSCPVDLKFDWGLISPTRAAAVYSVTRSDGGHGPSERLNLSPSRSVSVLYEWHLGADTPQFVDFHGWVELNIESPNPVTSRIPFTIHCGSSASVRVGGSAFFVNGQIARDHQYTGSCPVDLKFDWGVIGSSPVTVVYSFARSDGGRGPGGQLDLPANRSVPTYYEWRLGANTPQFADFHGWVELNIESPNPVSNRIAFTLHCQ